MYEFSNCGWRWKYVWKMFSPPDLRLVLPKNMGLQDRLDCSLLCCRKNKPKIYSSRLVCLFPSPNVGSNISSVRINKDKKRTLQVLVASSTSLGAVSEFFYGDSLSAVRAAHAAEDLAHGAHGEHEDLQDQLMAPKQVMFHRQFRNV